MELRKVTSKNIWAVTKLSVQDSQESFVATNTQSILEAYVTITSGHVALPFGLYENDVLVGFVMLGFGTAEDDAEPLSVEEGNYCIWRLMIDKAYQGRGFGKKAMEAILAYIRTWPCGEAEFCWLSYEPENEAAKQLYHAFGFRENGEICDDEIVAVLRL